MEAQYRTKDGRLVFKIDGEQKEIFRQVAQIQEVFEEEACGVCGTDLRYVVRVVEGNQFPELVCQNQKCRAKLAFGQNKKGGTIFPKRKRKDRKPSDEADARYDIKHRGWHVFKK
jgi:hypothetical protein